MLPAAISCNSGFHRCARALSMSVISALPRRPSLSPSRVASSSPPAPPPTMTMRCWRAPLSAPLALGVCRAIAYSWQPADRLAHETRLLVVESPAGNKVLHCHRVVACPEAMRFVKCMRVLDLIEIDLDAESRPFRHRHHAGADRERLLG